MKIFIAALIIFAIAGAADARARGKGGNGSKGGLQGTVVKVEFRDFIVTLKDDKTLKIYCDANTKFVSANKPAEASDVKEGVRVGIIGSMTGEDAVQATQITILGGEGKKK